MRETILQENTTNPIHAVVIHGVPELGKTCLAHALAYALATEENEPVYLKMADEVVDSDVVVDNLCSVIMNTKWVIVDQCDMDGFKMRLLAQGASTHFLKFNVPIVFMTSGHNPPAPDLKGFFLVKVIDIQTNEETLQSIVPSATAEEIGKILQVTKHYTRAVNLLLNTTGQGPKTKEELEEEWTESLTKIKLDRPAVLGLFLPVVHEDGTVDEYFTKEFVRTLASVQKDNKDLRDHGMNEVLNLTDICKLENENEECSIAELTESFTSLEKDEYAYRIRYPEYLRMHVDNYRTDFKVKGIDPTFESLRQAFVHAMGGHSNDKKTAGNIYEKLVALSCEETNGSPPHGQNYGLRPSEEQNIMEFTPVDTLCSSAFTVTQVVQEIQNKLEDEHSWEDEYKVGFILDVNKRRAFKGFDFAYAILKRIDGEKRLSKLNLIQASVNPWNRQTDKMQMSLSEFRTLLQRKELVPSEHAKLKVVPYILTPYLNASKPGSIQLPGNESVKIYELSVQRCPPPSLKNEHQ